MANTVSNVLAGKPLTTGGLYIAPTGTALPTTAVAALNAAFHSAGYVGEDGVTEHNERSTDKIKAWGGDTVKVVQTEFGATYEFTFIEAFNTDVLGAIWGSNVTTTVGTPSAGTKQTVKVNSDQAPHKAYVIEVQDGLARIRIVIGDGQVTEIGDIVYQDSDVVSYPVTVEAFYNTTQTANAIRYMDDGVFIP